MSLHTKKLRDIIEKNIVLDEKIVRSTQYDRNFIDD